MSTGTNSINQDMLGKLNTLSTVTTVDVTGSTLTATQAAHSNRVVTLSRAAGVTVTLPAAAGTGDRYTFVTKTAVTSNSNIVKVANGTDVMDLSLAIWQDSTTGAGTAKIYVSTAGDDTVTLNGGTTGGLAGCMVECIDYASGFWRVTVTGKTVGIVATPFSATV